MKLKAILVIIGILIAIFLVFRAFSKGSKQDVSDEGQTNFLSGIDFSKGNYAVLLQNNDAAFLIDDETVLKANSNRFKIKKSLKSFIPTEGLNTTGVYLFKDFKLLKSDVSNRPRTFEFGTLKENGSLLKLNGIREPREVYLTKKRALESNKNAFVIEASEVDSQGFEYSFILKSPAILVSNKDKNFSLQAYGLALKERLIKTLPNTTGFSIGADTYSDYSVPVLQLNQRQLRDSKTDEFLSLNDYVIHEPSMSFLCTKEFYEQVLTHDFGDAFSREGLTEAEIMSLITKRIGSNNTTISSDAIYAEMFTPNFKVERLKEKMYQLRYFELLEDSTSK